MAGSGRVAYGGRSGRRRGAAARRRKRPLRLARAIRGGLAAALKLARATRLVTTSSRRAAASRRPRRARAAAGSCSRGLPPAAGQLPGHRGLQAQAGCRRAVLYSSIQAATWARACAPAAQCLTRRSSNSRVECHDSMTALSS